MARDRASRPEAKPLRLFAAVEIPQEIRGALAEAVTPVRERFPKARWVPIQNQHVTVKFLGSTYPRLVEWVTATVWEVASRHAPFTTRVEGLGAFPNARRARVLWAGLDDAGSAFGRLAADLDEALAKEFTPEKRAFTSHLTVARFEPPVVPRSGRGRVRERPVRDRPDRAVPKPPAPPRSRVRADRDLPARFRA